MLNIKSIPFLFILISCSFIFSQENFSSSVIEPFQNEALNREKVFIHLNKTTFFTNEHIWFTAYVLEDANNTPSNYTTNLQVNVLNYNGDVINSKNIFIRNGIGHGDFLINNNYNSGKYYIQAFTNYMQNFGPENVFMQEIEVVTPSKNNEIITYENTINYDIQVFPESGYLLEGTENTLGIKVLINGKGYPFSGKIINSKGIEIKSFKGNLLGMGKCEFTYVKSESYTAVVDINNTIQKISLPKANRTGVIFGINNTIKDKIKLTLKTNKETLPTLKNEVLTLLFYRNNFICDAITLSLNNNQQTAQELFVDKNKMLNGVNVVTLFKNNRPIAERKFFVDKSNHQTAILIEELKKENDSINFIIKTFDSYYKPIAAQLSVSVLPKESEIFNEKKNIKSAFLLSPYIKGNIENAAFYFKNTNPKEKEFLDLLLLNQGWNIYSLEEKIREISPKEQFRFESGFTIHGKINRYPKGYDIGLLSKKNRLVAISKFNKDKEFLFENVFAYKNDSIKIALIKKNQPLVKPSMIRFIKPAIPSKNYDYLTNRYNNNGIIEKKPSSSSQNKKVLSSKKYPKTELLNEIVLKTAITKKKEITIYDIEMNLANKHNLISSGSYKNKKVTRQMETTYQTIFDYFYSLGFIKPMASNDVASYFISLRDTPATLIDLGRKANPDNTFPPRVFINDTMLGRYNNIKILQELSMTDIDEILINRSGAGGGVDGTGGIIRIYFKKSDHNYFGEGIKNLYESLILLTGFDRAKEYYKPQYNIYTKEAFNWTAIDWKHSVKTNKNGEVFLKIPVNGFSNEFQFIINGFSQNGLLFHDVYKTDNDDF